MGVARFVERLVSRVDEPDEVREAKTATYFVSLGALIVVLGLVLGTTVGTDNQAGFTFAASVGSVCLLAIVVSMALQMTLKALLPPLVITMAATLIGCLWTASATNLYAQGAGLLFVGAIVPSFGLSVAIALRLVALRLLIGFSVFFFLAYGALLSIHFTDSNPSVPMLPASVFTILGVAAALLHVGAGVAIHRQRNSAELVRRMMSSQQELEHKLGVVLRGMRTQLDGLIAAAHVDVPLHPAVVVAAKLLEASIDDAQSVMEFHVAYVSARPTDVRACATAAVEAIESYIAEVSLLQRHLDRRGATEPASVRMMDLDSVKELAKDDAGAELRQSHGIFGGGKHSAESRNSWNRPITFDLRIDEIVPNTVVTDERRFFEALKECTFSAAMRAEREVLVDITLEPVGPQLVVRFTDDGPTLSSERRKKVLMGKRRFEQEYGASLTSKGKRRGARGSSTKRLLLPEHLDVPPLGVPRVAAFLPLLGGRLDFDRSRDPIFLSGAARSGDQRGNTLIMRLRASPPEIKVIAEDGVSLRDPDREGGDEDSDDFDDTHFEGDLSKSAVHEAERAKAWRSSMGKYPLGRKRFGAPDVLSKHVPHTAHEADDEEDLPSDRGGSRLRKEAPTAHPALPTAPSPQRRFDPEMEVANRLHDAARPAVFWWPPRPDAPAANRRAPPNDSTFLGVSSVDLRAPSLTAESLSRSASSTQGRSASSARSDVIDPDL